MKRFISTLTVTGVLAASALGFGQAHQPAVTFEATSSIPTISQHDVQLVAGKKVSPASVYWHWWGVDVRFSRNTTQYMATAVGPFIPLISGIPGPIAAAVGASIGVIALHANAHGKAVGIKIKPGLLPLGPHRAIQFYEY